MRYISFFWNFIHFTEKKKLKWKKNIQKKWKKKKSEKETSKKERKWFFFFFSYWIHEIKQKHKNWKFFFKNKKRKEKEPFSNTKLWMDVILSTKIFSQVNPFEDEISKKNQTKKKRNRKRKNWKIFFQKKYQRQKNKKDKENFEIKGKKMWIFSSFYLIHSFGSTLFRATTLLNTKLRMDVVLNTKNIFTSEPFWRRNINIVKVHFFTRRVF